MSMQVFSQTTITGKITDSKGASIPGANVWVKGTTVVSISDANGNYSIKVPDDSKALMVSFMGMKKQEVNMNGRAIIDVVLENDDMVLDDVVVTALGIKRDKKALGYAVEEVSADEIAKSGSTDVVGAMQGQVAGVDIISAGGAGASTRIVIRGANSLNMSADNQPLFVVDGIPISNATVSGNVKPSTGSNASNSSEQFGFSNRAMDLNPNDIESMSILKGAAATALYGARAANGAVIITTKSGKKGTMLINFNSKFTYDYVGKFPEFQKIWGRGRVKTAQLDDTPQPAVGNSSTFYQYGYKLSDIGETYYDNMRNFYQTGMTYENSISFSGGSDKGNFYLSASNLSQEGIIPNTKWGRKNVKLSATRNISRKLKVSASASFINSGGRRGNQGDKSYMSSLLYWSPSVDIREYEDENGAMITHPYIDNPLYLVNHTYLEDDVNRIMGYVSMSYDILDNLTLTYRLGTDIYSDSRTYVVPYAEVQGAQPLDVASKNGGFIVEERINFNETNSDLMLSYDAKINDDLKFSAIIGNNVFISSYDRLNSRGETWASPKFYDISNTTYKYISNSDVNKRMIGIYGNIRFEFKNYLFLGITGRNDISSTLPVSERSYFYPSANLGFVFTDALNLKSNYFSYGKIRVSWAKVAKDAPAHKLDKLYTAYTFGGTTASLTTDNSLGNTQLKPEMTTSIEFGTDLRFFNNRLGLDFSYYKANTVDMLFPIPVAQSTGYTTILDNIGELENKGVELLLTATPVKTKNFKWNISVNYTKSTTEVLALNDELDEINTSSGYGGVFQKLVVGGKYGDMYGYTYKKHDNGDGTKSLIIGTDGRPIIDWDSAVYRGNVNPEWSAGITNTFTYKNLTLSFLFETKQGMVMADDHVRNMIRQGTHISTQNRPAASEGGVVLDGVNVDASGNVTTNVYPISEYRAYYRYTVASDVNTIVEDASWIRLRSASLTYSLPQNVINKMKYLKGLSVTISGNNLLLFTNFKGFDPEISKFGAGSNSQGYTGYSTPNTKRIGFALNVKF